MLFFFENTLVMINCYKSYCIVRDGSIGTVTHCIKRIFAGVMVGVLRTWSKHSHAVFLAFVLRFGHSWLSCHDLYYDNTYQNDDTHSLTQQGTGKVRMSSGQQSFSSSYFLSLSQCLVHQRLYLQKINVIRREQSRLRDLMNGNALGAELLNTGNPD